MSMSKPWRRRHLAPIPGRLLGNLYYASKADVRTPPMLARTNSIPTRPPSCHPSSYNEAETVGILRKGIRYAASTIRLLSESFAFAARREMHAGWHLKIRCLHICSLHSQNAGWHQKKLMLKEQMRHPASKNQMLKTDA
jgi:hypothetical protein